MSISKKSPTISEIAKLCGTSRTIASNILTGINNGCATQELRERVLAVADRLGYHAHVKCAHISRPGGRIAVVDLCSMPPGVARVRGCRFFVTALTECGYTVVCTPALAPHSNVPALSPAVVELQPDLLVSIVPLPTDLANKLREMGTRYVSLFQNSERLDKMVIECSLAQIEYLAARGCRNIAYCGSSVVDLSRLNALRANAVATYCENHGLNLQCFFAINSEREFCQQISELDTLPDAIACYNDEVAALVLAGSNRAGIKIPDDMKIIGIDNTPIAECLYPNLTSVKYEVMGSDGIESYIRYLGCSAYDPPKLATRAVVVPRESA